MQVGVRENPKENLDANILLLPNFTFKKIKEMRTYASQLNAPNVSND